MIWDTSISLTTAPKLAGVRHVFVHLGACTINALHHEPKVQQYISIPVQVSKSRGKYCSRQGQMVTHEEVRNSTLRRPMKHCLRRTWCMAVCSIGSHLAAGVCPGANVALRGWR